ncbi:MAG: SpoIIE family protein phosphatase [Parasporobacterium sp.]|nr:SpoIIE family protein phosphatase [Parasporobacterium sp.]
MNLVAICGASFILTVLFYILEEKTAFGRLDYKWRQLIIGIAFGIITCMATEFGEQIPGAVINARDAAPLSASLVFGGPSGIIAGIIGAVYRLFWGASFSQVFSAEWLGVLFAVGTPGAFTRLACTIGTFCAGLFGAIVRKTVFENKRTSWYYGLIVGFTVEVFHIFLVFIFRLNMLQEAFDVVKATTLPMVAANALTTMASVGVIQLITYLRKSPEEKKQKVQKTLSKSFQLFLFICVAVSFAVTMLVTALIQNKLALRQTTDLLQKNLNDIHLKIEQDGSIGEFILEDFLWHVGNGGGILMGVISYDEEDPEEFSVVVFRSDERYNQENIIYSKDVNLKTVKGVSSDLIQMDLILDDEVVPVYAMSELYEEDFIAVISFIPVAEANLFKSVSLWLTMFFEILLFAAMFVMLVILIRSLIVNNLNKINGKLNEITNGDLTAVADVRSHSEFSLLSDNINTTVDTLNRYIDEAERRIDEELKFAKAIQHSALPSVFPPYPNMRHFDIYATMDTAKQVGGDFYDFYFAGDRKFAFLIADVSGKGIPAAMFMMTAKTMIKSYAESGIPVDEVFTKANEKLCETNEAGMFVTAFMCIIDIVTGEVEYANAGHNPPLIYRNGQEFSYFSSKPNLVLAGMEGVKYRRGTFKMEPGDVFYMYTDGVTEAINTETELYGEERLLAAANELKGAHPSEICHKIKESVDRFSGEAEQFDDITMLAFIYKGEEQS